MVVVEQVSLGRELHEVVQCMDHTCAARTGIFLHEVADSVYIGPTTHPVLTTPVHGVGVALTYTYLGNHYCFLAHVGLGASILTPEARRTIVEQAPCGEEKALALKSVFHLPEFLANVISTRLHPTPNKMCAFVFGETPPEDVDQYAMRWLLPVVCAIIKRDELQQEVTMQDVVECAKLRKSFIPRVLLQVTRVHVLSACVSILEHLEENLLSPQLLCLLDEFADLAPSSSSRSVCHVKAVCDQQASYAAVLRELSQRKQFKLATDIESMLVDRGVPVTFSPSARIARSERVLVFQGRIYHWSANEITEQMYTSKTLCYAHKSKGTKAALLDANDISPKCFPW